MSESVRLKRKEVLEIK